MASLDRSAARPYDGLRSYPPVAPDGGIYSLARPLGLILAAYGGSEWLRNDGCNVMDVSIFGQPEKGAFVVFFLGFSGLAAQPPLPMRRASCGVCPRSCHRSAASGGCAARPENEVAPGGSLPSRWSVLQAPLRNGFRRFL